MGQNLAVKRVETVRRFVQTVTRLLDDVDALNGVRGQVAALGMLPGSGTAYEVTAADLSGSGDTNPPSMPGQGIDHLSPEDFAAAVGSLDQLQVELLPHLPALNRVRR